MKISCLIILLTGLPLGSQAQTAGTGGGSIQPSSWRITEKGANHQVWQRTTYETTPSGTTIPYVHKYTELATGLNHLVNGQWVASQETIDILPNGTAAATNGQHQAYFPGDIAKGAISLVTPGGRELQSRPIALSYDNGTNTVIISVLTNSVGYVLGSNQVVYPNAFEGASATLRYTYTRAGFEQDVVIEAQLPPPSAYGFDPKNTKLQVLTEFFDTNNPVQTQTRMNPRDGLSDTVLSFGTMNMVAGRAFAIGDTNQSGTPVEGTPSYKSWVHVTGRTFLIETIPYWRIAGRLSALPPALAANTGISPDGVLDRVSNRRLLPPARGIQAGTNRLQMAKAGLGPKHGVVLDYVTLDSGETNFTFQGDTTYFVDGVCALAGVTTFEGGTVIKANGSGELDVNSGSIVCLTRPFHPALFTSFNDNSVGPSISGSSGNPSPDDVNIFLKDTAEDASLHDLRFCYCSEAIDSEVNLEVRNSQFEEVYLAILADYDLGLYNVLINNASADSEGSLLEDGTNLVAENVTVDDGYYVVETDYPGTVLALTNCIFTGQSDITSAAETVYTNSTVHLGVIHSAFQTVAGGGYYLSADSPYRNAGTANIDSELLADLEVRTTYPPIVYTNTTFSVSQTFSPQAQRDTDTPDIGYHYDPIDYAFGGCVADSNVTFTAGTVAGWFRTSSGWSHDGYGIDMGPNVTISFNGTASSPTWFVRLNTVQEQDFSGGIGQGGIDSQTSSDYPTVYGRFLKCSAMAGHEMNGYFADDYGELQAEMTDCEFWGGFLHVYTDYMFYTNCLMWRVKAVGLDNGDSHSSFTMRNCTLYGGVFHVYRNSGGPTPVSVRDCAFDGTSISTSDYYSSNTNYTDYDYNAFVTNDDRTSPQGTNDVIVTNFNWEPSWFGDFYLPTNSPLIDKGSTNADLVGLYHFTTQTNQVPETNSIVDIGYHYVATDSVGSPIDTDGDGVPDYLEDANGNGVVDSGETDWTNAADPGLKVYITEPQNNSILP